MPVFALAGGSLIFVGFLVVLVIVFSYHTYKGSAINAHPHDASDQAPGAGDPSDPGGQSRTHEAHGDELGAGGGGSRLTAPSSG